MPLADAVTRTIGFLLGQWLWSVAVSEAATALVRSGFGLMLSHGKVGKVDGYWREPIHRSKLRQKQSASEHGIQIGGIDPASLDDRPRPPETGQCQSEFRPRKEATAVFPAVASMEFITKPKAGSESDFQFHWPAGNH